MTEQMIIDNTDVYLKQQLNAAIDLYRKRDFATVQMIRAQLHYNALLLLFQNLIDLEGFNNMEIFINNMLGGKTDRGISEKR